MVLQAWSPFELVASLGLLGVSLMSKEFAALVEKKLEWAGRVGKKEQVVVVGSVGPVEKWVEE